MVDREEVREVVEENVEVTEAGDWYIAEGSYGEHETVAQAGSRGGAINRLISEICSRESLCEQKERHKEREKEFEDWTDRVERQIERLTEESSMS